MRRFLILLLVLCGLACVADLARATIATTTSNAFRLNGMPLVISSVSTYTTSSL